MYQALKASSSEFVPIRNLNYHVRVWGEPDPARAPRRQPAPRGRCGARLPPARLPV